MTASTSAIIFNKSHVIGTIEIILAFSLAGSTIVVGKMLSVRVPVFTTGALSLAFAFITMLPVQWSKRQELKKLTKHELGLMLLQALFGIALFRIFTLYGLKLTSASNASIITAATPAIMALFSVLLLKERLKLNAFIGVVAALAALLLINLGDGPDSQGTGSQFGNSLIMLAVISEVLLTIFRRFTKAGISSITNTTVLSLLAFLMLLPMAIWELQTFDLFTMATKDWIAIIYYGAIATSTAYILWGDGALRIPASYTGVATVSMPFSALLLSNMVLGEPLTLLHIIGLLLAASGIICCNVELNKSFNPFRRLRNYRDWEFFQS